MQTNIYELSQITMISISRKHPYFMSLYLFNPSLSQFILLFVSPTQSFILIFLSPYQLFLISIPK